MLLLSLWVSLLILTNHTLYFFLLIFASYLVIERLPVDVDFFGVASRDLKIEF